MKGIINKTENGWQVSHVTYDISLEKWTAGKFPLHPSDVKQIEEDAKIFDNIEARIAAYPEVEFEVQTIAIGTDESDLMDCDVAKLIKK